MKKLVSIIIIISSVCGSLAAEQYASFSLGYNVSILNFDLDTATGMMEETDTYQSIGLQVLGFAGTDFGLYSSAFLGLVTGAGYSLRTGTSETSSTLSLDNYHTGIVMDSLFGLGGNVLNSGKLKLLVGAGISFGYVMLRAKSLYTPSVFTVTIGGGAAANLLFSLSETIAVNGGCVAVYKFMDILGDEGIEFKNGFVLTPNVGLMIRI